MYLRTVMRSRGIGAGRVSRRFFGLRRFFWLMRWRLAAVWARRLSPSASARLAVSLHLRSGMPSAWPLMRHRNGYVREAALNALEVPIVSAEELRELADRLNDWVPEVRTAALAAARRLFATASTDAVVAAAPYLLSRWSLWQRWEPPAIAEVDALLGRPDVVRQLASGLMSARNGGVGRQLQHLLRHEWIDGFLVELARGAVQPQVRKVAFQTLLAGEARWRSPHVKRAEELRYAIYKSGLTFEHRPLTVHVDRNVLVEAGLRDRFASVRWLAAGALVESSVQVAGEEQAIARLLKDKSRSVRERGQFLARGASVANGD